MDYGVFNSWQKRANERQKMLDEENRQAQELAESQAQARTKAEAKAESRRPESREPGKPIARMK